MFFDGEDSPPLGKAAAHLVVLLGPFVQSVQAGCPTLFSAVEYLESLVHLDASHNAFVIQHLDELLSFGVALSGCLVKEDHS